MRFIQLRIISSFFGSMGACELPSLLSSGGCAEKDRVGVGWMAESDGIPTVVLSRLAGVRPRMARDERSRLNMM